MKPFDPRLLRYAKETRPYIAFLVTLGVLSTILIAAQTFLIAGAASPVFYGEKTPAQVRGLIGILLGIFVLRFALTYLQHAIGHRSAVRVIAQLRSRVLRHVGDLESHRAAPGRTAKIVTQTTRGLDDLEAYFVSFLPELFLCVTATPALLLVLYVIDWVSALAITLCIPLIPIFMILIGKMTAKYASARLQAMERLGSQLLDLLAGLTTLKALGREQGPKERVKLLGKQFAEKTMQTLYVAFLSGAALEFIATLSTAIVAVEVGFRMVAGQLLLFEGLVIIMLTPEVFKPLREVGTQFHASTNGIAAAQEAFAALETPLPQLGGQETVPDMRTANIELENVSVFAPGRATVAPAQLSAVIKPGAIAVLRGQSGAGKSTTIQVLLGLLAPDAGRVLIGGKALAELDLSAWWRQITWVSQRPALVPGTVAENMGLADTAWLTSATTAGDTAAAPLPPALAHACAVTGFDHVVASLPNDWHTRIGQGGVGLSVGQRQRLALTRALISATQIVILDEPSAHLDAVSEEYVAASVQELKAAGHTVIIIAHRAAIAGLADTVIDVHSATRDIRDEVTAARLSAAERHRATQEAAQQIDYAMPESWRTSANGANPNE